MSNAIPPFKLERMVLQALCSMMKESDLQTQIHPGAVARIHAADRFRWVLNWYAKSGEREAFEPKLIGDPTVMHFVVVKALHPLLHKPRRYRLDSPHYLRRLRTKDLVVPDLQLLSTRTLYI